MRAFSGGAGEIHAHGHRSGLDGPPDGQTPGPPLILVAPRRPWPPTLWSEVAAGSQRLEAVADQPVPVQQALT